MNKRYLSVILLLALLTASCGTQGPSNDTTAPDAGTTTPVTEAGYDYAGHDLGGRQIMVLTANSYWGMNVHLDAEEQNGEPLNDAVYARNRKVEEKLNCTIRDNNYGAENTLADVATLAQTEILAGDANHDVMYIQTSKASAYAAESFFVDLSTLGSLNLDAEYWDHVYNNAAEIDGKLWYASSDAYLNSYNTMWCLFFNERIMEASKLTSPYDVVREGKWTLDKLYEYCSSLANVNADASFDWKVGGSAVYGLVTHTHADKHFVLASDNRYINKEKNGSYKLIIDNERFYDTCEKIAKLYGEEGTTIHGHYDDFSPDKGYVYTFFNERAVFLTAELKTANNIRDMETSFGVLPFPKFDEKQTDYCTPISHDLIVMTIPTTVDKPDEVALVMDALSFESMNGVVPTYFDVTVSQKGLRNEDSIEMMEIMRRTRATDIGYSYGWVTTTATAVGDLLKAGDAQVSSTIASSKTAIETSIKDFMKVMGID
ncbi:MAG: extracellular solute-binding protein [Clostridia bacterium]|nr:extracellular solute-binding protein [Clostridia bacterium]